VERTDVTTTDPDALGGADRWPLSASLGASDVAINRYRIDPGEGFPGGLHAHADQEEIFVVVDGEATFETLPDPDGEGREVTVPAGEAVRFPPGEFQSGHNAGDDELVALAVGAPRDSVDVRVPFPCTACDAPALRLDLGADGVSFVCPSCEATSVPGPCPDCGAGELQSTLGADGHPEVVCLDCGGSFDRPPVAQRE
jgi:uncharacterized cupin superfamily protein